MKCSAMKRFGLLGLALVIGVSGCFPHRKVTDYKKFMDDAKKKSHVTEWTKKVPEGMEVRYVLVRERRVDYDNNLTEYVYEYDEYGNRCTTKDVLGSGEVTYTLEYDEKGQLLKKSTKHTGNVGYRSPDCDVTYEYDNKGHVISCEAVMYLKDNKTDNYSYQFEYDKDGHLVSSYYSSRDGEHEETYTFAEYGLPCFDYCVLADESRDVIILRREYNEQGQVICEIDGENVKVFTYDNWDLTGWSVNNNKYTYSYDAFGNLLGFESLDGEHVREIEYDEHNTQVLSKEWKEDELISEIKTTCVYDDAGHLVEETSEFNLTDRSFTAKTVYTYDEHGLLIMEEESIDGRFTDFTVYDYEAILVPKGS